MKHTSIIMKIPDLCHKFRNLIYYGIIGACSSSLDFAVYSLLVHSGFNYLLSNCISVLIGITTSFTLNRQFNFKVKDAVIRRFTVFLTVGLCGMMLSNLILYICIESFGINKLISKLLSIILVVLIQFIINKNVTFKPSKK